MPQPSTEIEECLAQGRKLFQCHDWLAAIGAAQRALAIAIAGSDARAIAVCQRFVGQCEYRRGGAEALARAESHYREAIRIAHTLDDTRLRLVVSNHLGSTLRDLGRHDEAYDLFRGALREAVGGELVAVRARLLGNLGALLEELGQREGAADCYARYEELVEHVGDTRRLANARGLAGRAALLRGDLDEAEWRFGEELRIGQALDEKRRRSSAHKHLAELAVAHLARAPTTEREEDVRWSALAEKSFADAWANNAPNDDKKHRVSIGLSQALFLRQRGQLSEAHRVLSAAHTLATELDHAVLQSKVEQTRAIVCGDVGLHGEALWYLSKAAQRRVALIRGLKNERVRAMAQPWLDDLRATARDLWAEAFRVPRGAAERDQITALFTDVGAALGEDYRPLVPRIEVDPWDWHDALREQSVRRWRAILGADFSRLHGDSQGDLVLADVTYHGAVDDLARSAHLLAVTMERELRERVVVPIRRVVDAHTGEPSMKSYRKTYTVGPHPAPTLSTMLQMVGAAVEEPVRAHFERAFGRERLAQLVAAASRIRRVTSVSGGEIDLIDARNAVAHGRPSASRLDRVAVDAFKRTLTLEAPVVLKEILNWPLAG
jgi:tetratricopeptide (TPR) repeat protein